MNRRAVSESPRVSFASKKEFLSPSNNDTWVCIPEPWTPASGLGMNDANTPCSCAISLITRRTVMIVSAIVRASVYRRSISCWLGASSCCAYSTGTPMSSSVSTVRLRKSVARSATVSSKYEPESSGCGGASEFAK